MVEINMDESKCKNNQQSNSIDDDEDDNEFMQEMQLEFPLHITDDDDDDDEEEEYNKGESNKKKHIPHLNLAAGWDDSAILRCFDLAIQTHDSQNIHDHCAHPFDFNVNAATDKQKQEHKRVEERSRANTGDNAVDPPLRWRPGDLPLPQWAIDPWYAIQNGFHSKVMHDAKNSTHKKNDTDQIMDDNLDGRIKRQRSTQLMRE